MSLNKILKFKGSVACLAVKIQLQENISVATHRLTPIVRHKFQILKRLHSKSL